MSISSPSLSSLADLVVFVQGSELPQKKRQEMVSAMRTAARVVGLDLGLIPLDVVYLRRRLEDASPEAHGVSQRRWANVRSLLGQALALARPLLPARQIHPLSEAWERQAHQLPKNRRIRLLPVMRQLSAWGVEPDRVQLRELERYRDQLLANRLRAGAEKSWDGIVWAWNASVREVPGWPSVEIPRPSKRESYVLPWERLAASYHQEVKAYLQERALPDLSGMGNHKPARPATLQTREYQLRAAASVLVLSGVPVESLTSIAALLTFANYQTILRFYLDRNGGKPSVQAGQMAGFLKDIAIHWVRVDEETAAKMRRVASNLAPKRRGMTAKNREKLSALDNRAQVEAYLSLPVTIQLAVMKDKRPPRLKAVLAQMAAAIALEQVSLIRRKNLAAVRLDRHLIWLGEKCFLRIDEIETKNGDPIDLELPDETTAVINWYVTEYRPYLHSTPTDALFPGEGGAPKNPATLATQIKQTIRRFTGLDLNIHLLRHAGGKIFLDQKPGQYEVMRRVLGHRSIATTTSYYAGAEQRAAGAHFARVLEERRQALTSKLTASKTRSQKNGVSKPQPIEPASSCKKRGYRS